jgi:hypothetical protein
MSRTAPPRETLRDRRYRVLAHRQRLGTSLSASQYSQQQLHEQRGSVKSDSAPTFLRSGMSAFEPHPGFSCTVSQSS